MKKILAITLLFICLGKIMGQQQEILFSPEFQPNKKYEIVMNINENIIMTLDSIDKIERERILEQLGGKESMSFSLRTGTKNKIFTKEKFENKLPFEMNVQVLETEVKMGDSVILKKDSLSSSSSKIYGFLYDKIKVKVDSVVNNSLTDSLKKTVASMMENTYTNVAYPVEPMKIGNSFTQEVPMNIAIPGFDSIEMIVVTTYKLTDVIGNKVFFNLVQNLKMKSDNTSMTMFIKGEGKGKLEYDIQNKITSLVQSKIDIQGNYNIQEINFTMTGKLETSITNNITN